LKALEKAIRVTAAFWFHAEDEDRWKLFFVSPDVAEKGQVFAYKKLFALLKDLDAEAGRKIIPVDQITVDSPASFVYRMVKKQTGPVGGPVREGPGLDSYIYKMT
jgi:hypothetical protein